MSLLTSAPISALAVELLRRSLVLVGTATRIPAGEYSGPSGGTVTLAIPTPRTAREQATRAAAITYDQLAEVGLDVSVSHWYDAALVSDEELSLDIREFGRQVLRPQIESVARAAEDQLAAVMNALTVDPDIGWALAPDPTADEATVLEIRQALTVNEVPAGDRYVAVAPDIATRLLKVPNFVQADRRGATAALEQAIIGTVYGLTFVESPAIDAGTAVAYHKSGLAFGTATPLAPGGGADSTTATQGGVALRHVLAFDPGHLATASVVSVFAGAAVVPENQAGTTIKRAIRIDTATGS
jgi:hypothetical protein